MSGGCPLIYDFSLVPFWDSHATLGYCCSLVECTLLLFNQDGGRAWGEAEGQGRSCHVHGEPKHGWKFREDVGFLPQQQIAVCAGGTAVASPSRDGSTSATGRIGCIHALLRIALCAFRFWISTISGVVVSILEILLFLSIQGSTSYDLSAMTASAYCTEIFPRYTV